MNLRPIRQPRRAARRFNPGAHLFSIAIVAALAATLLTSSPASATPRYELVLQDGQYQYVIDNANGGSKAWAGHCDLGTPRNVTWNDIKDMDQGPTPDCAELKRRVEANITLVFNQENTNNQTTNTPAATNTGSSQTNTGNTAFVGHRYRLVLQDSQYQYLLDITNNTKTWAGHCDLGQPESTTWAHIRNMRQEATPDCSELQRRMNTNPEPTQPYVEDNCTRNGANNHTRITGFQTTGNIVRFTHNGENFFQMEFTMKPDCDAVSNSFTLDDGLGTVQTFDFPTGTDTFSIPSNYLVPGTWYVGRSTSVFADGTVLRGNDLHFSTPSR